MKLNWLNRTAQLSARPYLLLCMTEAEYLSAAKHLNVVHGLQPWKGKGPARTYLFDHPDGGICCVVCIEFPDDYTPTEIAGCLVHEAVHIWQWYAESIGEHKPAIEQEAYEIQTYSLLLMNEYARRIS